MIKAYLEEAIKKIEMEKEQQASIIKDRLTREKIAPYNADIDSSRAKALTEVDNELNAKIAELKKTYEAKKQELVTLGEEKKKANAETVFASELAVFTVKYDKEITKLKAQLAEIEE